MYIIIILVILILAFLLLSFVGSNEDIDIDDSVKFYYNKYNLIKGLLQGKPIEKIKPKIIYSKAPEGIEGKPNTEVEIHIPEVYKNIDNFEDMYNGKCYFEYDFEIKNHKGLDSVIIPKGFTFYKGMDSFYPVDFKFQRDPRNKLIWYGDKSVALFYAIRYNGSINAYEFLEDTKLLLVNGRNMHIIYENLKKHLKGKANEEILKWYSVKFNVNITEEERLALYQSINRKGNIYKCKIEENKNTIMNMLGDGKLDRITYNLVNLFICQHGFKGFVTYPAKTIYRKNCELNGEFILTDPSVVKRNTGDPVDWTNWEFDFDFPKKDFVFNPRFKTKNRDHQMIKFYVNNLEKTKITSKGYKIGTINVHFFSSINILHTPQDCVDALFEFMDYYDLDILGVQEVSLRDVKLPDNYNYYLHESDTLTNMVICKDNLKIYSEFLDGIERKRNVIFVEGKYKIAVTHLEIFNVYNPLITEEERLELRDKMTEIQIKQVEQIKSNKPDIMMGDFNFNHEEEPYNHTKKEYDDGETDPTTPFGTTVDYIWVNKKSNIKMERYVVNYIHSDHKAVIGIINE